MRLIHSIILNESKGKDGLLFREQILRGRVQCKSVGLLLGGRNEYRLGGEQRSPLEDFRQEQPTLPRNGGQRYHGPGG